MDITTPSYSYDAGLQLMSNIGTNMIMDVDNDSDDSSGVDDETDQAIKDFLNTDSPSLQICIPTLNYSPYETESISILKTAMLRNKEAEAKYYHLENCLYRALAEVRTRLNDINVELMKEANTTNEGGFSYLRSGRPYFKDKNNYAAPDNVDTIMMRQAEMYDFSQVSSVPGWTIKDKTELVNALQELSRDIKKKELNAKLVTLNKEDNIVEIAKIEKELNQLSEKSLMEIALPLDQEYDWDALANSLNRRHTAQEYQALWKLFLHPSIVKSSWSVTEHQELQKIATSADMQDWDNIATTLNTGRTGYQCFVYYRTNMIDISSNRRWTSEEIEYLQRVIDYFREGTYIPWGKVAAAMENRTKIQVYNKYTRMMERRKGRFLEEEDMVILNCHDKYGFNFKKIAEYLPGRSAVQLRTRFKLLTKFRVSKTWTVDDDRKLIQIMANIDSPANFSTATVHFPGKDRMHIRSRYITLMKWMKAHPATDLAMAPRRGARRLLHGHAHLTLNEAVANLHKRMESEVRSKKKKRITKFSCEEDIEDGIMAALINEIIKEETNRKPEPCEVDDDNDISSGIPNNSSAELDDMANLRRLLIFLNSSLNQKKFNESNYAKLFSGLTEKVPEVSHLKVKSYSKKQSVKTLKMSGAADVWGNRTIGTTKYVLPPNYATITGCRVLIKHAGTQPQVCPDDEINLSLMARRNIFLKEALTKLKERFTSIFLWPMLLSNDAPIMVNQNETYVPRQVTIPKYLPEVPGVTIPKLRKCLRTFRDKKSRQKPVV